MKRLFTAILLLSMSFSAQAALDSVEIFGTFINDDGCRAYNVNCVNVEFDDDETINNCSLELYVDGEYVASLGKGGHLIETDNEVVVGRDRGLRSSMVGIPTWVNVEAEFLIKKTYFNPSTYAKTSVSSFDISITKGLFGKTYTCTDMVFEPNDDY